MRSSNVYERKGICNVRKRVLWDAALLCHQILERASIPHSICGGVAVCLHGYQRNTIDVDVIINSRDSSTTKDVLLAESFQWNEELKEFRSTSGVPIQFLIAGERAGRGSEVMIPEPVGESNVEQLEGLSVVCLSRLIEMKLASGMGNLRRTHKDYADVVELIAIRKLDSAFARFLHSSLRPTFRELVHRVTDVDE